MSALEGEISRCTSDQLLGLKENINTLFAKCVQTLAHEHNIRVVNALLVSECLAEGTQDDPNFFISYMSDFVGGTITCFN